MRIDINYYINKIKNKENLTQYELLDLCLEYIRLETVVQSYVLEKENKKCQN